MRLRKLIRADVLGSMRKEVQLGVPVARAMAKRGLTDSITRPTVVSLLNALDELHDNMEVNWQEADRISNSLFPAWMDPTGPAVQEQPEGIEYQGTFPTGSWVCRT